VRVLFKVAHLAPACANSACIFDASWRRVVFVCVRRSIIQHRWFIGLYRSRQGAYIQNALPQGNYVMQPEWEWRASRPHDKVGFFSYNNLNQYTQESNRFVPLREGQNRLSAPKEPGHNFRERDLQYTSCELESDAKGTYTNCTFWTTASLTYSALLI
jgi:hypothetical protein